MSGTIRPSSGSAKKSALAQKIEKDLEIQKLKKLFDTLDVQKRDLNKHLRTATSQEEINTVIPKDLLSGYSKNYDEAQSILNRLGETEQAEFSSRLSSHELFLGKIKRQSIELLVRSPSQKRQASPPKPVRQTPPTPEKHTDVTIEEPPITAKRDDSFASLSSVSSGESGKSQTLDERFMLIKSEPDTTKKSELALKFLLESYFGEKNESQINIYLTELLPIAFPNRFEKDKTQLRVLGEDREPICDALGITAGESIQIDALKFNIEKLNNLKTLLPKESGLWSFLKSYKPIDNHYFVANKVDACLELLDEIRQNKIIHTRKFNYSMQIINYASALAKQHDERSLMKVKSLFLTTTIPGSQDFTDLKAWLKKKWSNQSSILIPENLKDNWTEKPVNLQREQDAISAWRNQQDNAIKNLPQSDEFIKNKKELKNKIYELYDAEIRFMLSMYELRDIVRSRIMELSEPELNLLKNYLKNLEQLLENYAHLREKFPIPEKQFTTEKVIRQIATAVSSSEFLSYMKTRDALSRAHLEITQLNENHHHFLDSRSVFDTSFSLEVRNLPKIASYTIKLPQITSQLNLLYGDIEKYVKKLNNLALTSQSKLRMPFESKLVDDIALSVQFVSALGSEANRGQAEGIAKDYAKTKYNQALKTTDSIQAARISILNLYSDKDLKGKDSQAYLNAYLQYSLPKAWPQLFKEKAGKIHLQTNPYTQEILEALGQTSEGQLDLQFNNKLFNPNKLKELETLFPQEKMLWSLLKSFAPFSQNYTASDKVQACIEVAIQVSQGEVIRSQKVKNVLNILSFSSKEAEDYKIEFNASKKDIPLNLLRVKIENETLFYCVKDPSYEVQEGSIKLSEMEPNRKKREALKAAFESGDNTILQPYLAKILSITTEKGFTFDKSKAMEPIDILTNKNYVASKTDGSDLEILRAWINREVATKGTHATSTGLETENILMRFLRFIKNKVNAFIYDYFQSRKSGSSQDSVLSREEPKDKPVGSEGSSNESILSALAKVGSPINSQANKSKPIHRNLSSASTSSTKEKTGHEIEPDAPQSRRSEPPSSR